MGGLTCLTCQVGFTDSELHRNHFKGDWHRYNLKRKVANLPSVTPEEFETRKASHEPKVVGKIKEKEAPTYCIACRKKFSNCKAFDNHLDSKKHKDMVVKAGPEGLKVVKEKALETIQAKDAKKPKVEEEKVEKKVEDKDGATNNDEEMEEVDSDEWEEFEDDPLPVTNCLFCSKQFKTLEVTARHMTETHSFYLPDPEYLEDLLGLMEYLGAKVGQGMMCLWCSENSKQFNTLDAVQNHMVDKGHCRLKHEGASLLEYAEYYDYSSSYPEGEEGDKEKNDNVRLDELDDTGYLMTLPSGATVGHRSLYRYFRQSINPNRELVLAKAMNRPAGSSSHQLLSTYRAMGWSGTSKQEVQKKVRDIKYMSKHFNKQHMSLGMQNNLSKRMHFKDRNAGLQ